MDASPKVGEGFHPEVEADGEELPFLMQSVWCSKACNDVGIRISWLLFAILGKMRSIVLTRHGSTLLKVVVRRSTQNLSSMLHFLQNVIPQFRRRSGRMNLVEAEVAKLQLEAQDQAMLAAEATSVASENVEKFQKASTKLEVLAKKVADSKFDE